jgi:hypothetical protein
MPFSTACSALPRTRLLWSLACLFLILSALAPSSRASILTDSEQVWIQTVDTPLTLKPTLNPSEYVGQLPFSVVLHAKEKSASISSQDTVRIKLIAVTLDSLTEPTLQVTHQGTTLTSSLALQPDPAYSGQSWGASLDENLKIQVRLSPGEHQLHLQFEVDVPPFTLHTANGKSLPMPAAIYPVAIQATVTAKAPSCKLNAPATINFGQLHKGSVVEKPVLLSLTNCNIDILTRNIIGLQIAAPNAESDKTHLFANGNPNIVVSMFDDKGKFLIHNTMVNLTLLNGQLSLVARVEVKSSNTYIGKFSIPVELTLGYP